MPNILIRNVPQKTIRYAKRLARQHRTSLQEEIRTLVVQALDTRMGSWSAAADRIRRRFEKEGKHFSNSVDLIREDRMR